MSPQVSSMLIRGRAGLAVNKPNEPVPPGWVWVPVNSVARQETGHTPSRSHPEWWGGDIPWIGIKDARLHHGGVIFDTLQTTNPLGLANSSARLLPKGTVCLSRTASVGYVTIMGRDMATSQDFVTWTCSEALVPEFLVKALLAEGEGLRKFGKGTTHTTIYFPEIRALHICLPPLAEQTRIVAKLDALNAKSAHARTELARIETLVSRYKQAVLSKAFVNCTGRLRCLADLIEPDAPIRYGVLQPGTVKDVGVPLVRVCDLMHGRVTWAQLRRIEATIDNQFANARIKNGDILLSVVGTIGRIALVEGMIEPTNIARAVARLRPNQSIVTPEWLALRLQANDCQESFSGDAREVARKTLNVSMIRAVKLVLPPLEEQHEIVRRIESAFAKIDRLAKEAKRALELVGRLDEAILAKAFRGELVPQDENDEPAEHLLARIRAQRDKAPKGKRGRGAKG